MQQKPKYPSSQKLWRVVDTADGGYFYEIKLAGKVVEWIPIGDEALKYLKDEGLVC